MRNINILSAAFCLCLAVFNIRAAENNEIAVPKFDFDIKIDGKMSADVWIKVPVYQINEPEKGNIPAGCGTSLRLWKSGKALYLGFRCESPYSPFLKTEERYRDGAVYSDECIEIFVNTGMDPPLRQIVFNPSGSVYDGYAIGEKKWDGDFRCVTSVSRGVWTAELAIPFSDFANAKSITINCHRIGCLKDNDERWVAAWKAPALFSPYFKINLRD